MLHTETTVDLSQEQIGVKVRPPMRYTAARLEIGCPGLQLNIMASNEQLADIAESILLHLQAVRYHETPDHQQILNHEYEFHTEVEV